MKLEQRKNIVFVLLALLMLLLFNDPILSTANRNSTLAGIPVLHLYLFGSWAVCILLLFLQAQMRIKKKK